MWSSYLNNTLRLWIFTIVFPLYAFGATFPQVWHVPPENPNFVGRADILERILTTFRNSTFKTVVIAGPQGFGKSQTAKHFIYQNFSNYDVVWWFRSNQYMKLQFEKFSLAVAPLLGLKIEETIHSIGHERLITMIKEGIRQKNLKCLIIFDDTQSYPDIEPYALFSHEGRVHTIITTKNSSLSANAIPIKPFARQDSIMYIDRFFPNDPSEDKLHLAKYLCDCPAALALSIEYIKSSPGMTIKTYIEKHQSEKNSFLPVNEFANKLDSSVDGYETNVLTSIEMDMIELRQHSQDAFSLLGLLSLLHRDEIPLSLLENWARLGGIKTNMTTMIGLLNRYSLIEYTRLKDQTEGYISMQELVQKIVNSLIPNQDKKYLIEDAASLLKRYFSNRGDKNVEAILKDNRSLLNTIKISSEAHDISYHSPNLMYIRIRALDALAGLIRDFTALDDIIRHLAGDFKVKVPHSTEDAVLYYANMALYASIRSPNYEQAIAYGLQALQFINSVDGMHEERIRILANLIQHHSFAGLLEEGAKYITMGEESLHLSQSDSYNSLFIVAKSAFLLDMGDPQQAIDLITKTEKLWSQQSLYPSMRYYIPSQLAEALIRLEKLNEAKNALMLSEKWSRDFHGDNDQNFFFGRLYVLKGSLLLLDSQYSPEEAMSLLQKGITVYQDCFHATDKHRGQAFAHLMLGKAYFLQGKHGEAKAQFFISKDIFANLLKNDQIDDVSELYTQLSLLGIEMKDEALTNQFLKKQIKTFGIDHLRTKLIFTYLDEKSLPIPM